MQVTLAGYNIDSSLIQQLDSAAATPEVLSAAYARISRSPLSVTELRREALQELPKARKSNSRIIFELGHASVAEHAVFNFDIIGISRLLTDALETIRLASFTEKSQRYVTFSQDYVVPGELEPEIHRDLKALYLSAMNGLFAEYQASIADLHSYYARKHPKMPEKDRDCLAKEDARYILPLATKTQLGMTLNARSLENLLQRLASNPLQEAAELRAQLLEPVARICPSLVRYTEKDKFTGTFQPGKLNVVRDNFSADECVRALNVTSDTDDLILAALLFEQSSADFGRCRDKIASLDFEAKQALWQQVFAHIQPWHKMRRAFELVDITFELRMSESCWAQFKRHRMGTIIRQQKSAGEIYTVPPAIQNIGRAYRWEELIEGAEKLAGKLHKVLPDISAYARLNSCKVKLLAKMNLRELYHFVRLRSDAHAQWEIRNLSHSITDHLRVFCPHATAFLCGKSELRPVADRQKD